MTMKLHENPVHLGLGAKILSEPRFTGMEWYEAYAKRYADDGIEGRLVSMHSFSASWDVWEMHPKGEELVVCTAGELTLIQEINNEQVRTLLNVGEYAINPRGVWHTANVDSDGEVTALFITAGVGTEHRSRD